MSDISHTFIETTLKVGRRAAAQLHHQLVLSLHLYFEVKTHLFGLLTDKTSKHQGALVKEKFLRFESPEFSRTKTLQ